MATRGSWINPAKLQSQTQMIRFLKITWTGHTRDIPQRTRNVIFSFISKMKIRDMKIDWVVGH